MDVYHHHYHQHQLQHPHHHHQHQHHHHPLCQKAVPYLNFQSRSDRTGDSRDECNKQQLSKHELRSHETNTLRCDSSIRSFNNGRFVYQFPASVGVACNLFPSKPCECFQYYLKQAGARSEPEVVVDKKSGEGEANTSREWTA